MNTEAQRIVTLPFWQAIREADMFAVDVQSIGGDDVCYTFADGSKLYTRCALNELEL